MNYRPLTADELLTCHLTQAIVYYKSVDGSYLSVILYARNDFIDVFEAHSTRDGSRLVGGVDSFFAELPDKKNEPSMATTRRDVAVVMITTDRKPSYFAETVRALYRSEGINNDSDTRRAELNRSGVVFGVFTDTSNDPARNASYALKWGSEQGRAWVLFLEDDLRFCDRFIDSVAEWLTIRSLNLGFSRYPIALFGSAAVDADGNAVYGRSGFLVHTALIPVKGFYGTQAFAIRAGDAAILSEYLFASTNPAGQYDLTIAEWCKLRGADYLVASIPSFVQHIGEESSIRPGEPHSTFPSWPGEEWSYVDVKNISGHRVDKQATIAPEAESNSRAPVFTTSRRVRAADFRSDWLCAIAAEMEEPVSLHRKLWEYAAIAEVFTERIESQRLLLGTPERAGRRPRVVGFGVGRDPLAAWFASRGAEVVATDKPADLTSEDWKSTGQHAAGKDQLRRFNSTTDEDWIRVLYLPADMNEITGDVGMQYLSTDYDLTWSCGSFEHIGGLTASLDFFVHQMACLRPGGVAVHTTEYSVNHNLYDTAGLCLLRRSDITRLAARLAEQGDLLLPFDPDGGDEPADLYVDYPPYPGNQFGPYHLNLALSGDTGNQYITTSIVLIAIRGGIRLEKERIAISDKLITGDVAAVNSPFDSSHPNVTIVDVFPASGFAECIWFEGTTSRRALISTVSLRKVKIESVPSLPSVLFLGDAIAPTGFAKSTHAVCDYLYSRGWNVRVCGMNYYGQLPSEGNGQHTYPYPIHPAFDPVSGPGSPDGATLLPRLIYDYQPDIVVIQQDPWNVPTYLNAIDHVFSTTGRQTPPIVGFLAVDSANQSSAIHLNRLAHVATWTQYGADELRKGGYHGPLSIVPLGVDTAAFRPLDRAAIRAEFAANFVGKGAANMAEGIDPSTAFIVGYVGRNQLRKRLDLLIQYFAEFARDRSNTLLYLYVDQATEFDLRSLVHYWGADGKVIVERSDSAHPADDEYMCRLYNLFDVFATCTQGEGWWLPGFEAAACGVPIVAPDYSAIGELFEPCSGALLVPCPFTVVTAPMGAPMHTLGGLVSGKGFVNSLRVQTHRDLHDPAVCADFARKYPWSEIGRKFDLMLREEVLGLPVSNVSSPKNATG